MVTSEDLLTPNWELDWLNEGGAVVKTTVLDSDNLSANQGGLPKGTQFGVSGTILRTHSKGTNYLYVIQLDDHKNVAVLYPAQGGAPDREKAGAALHLPSAPGQWFVAPIDGRVRVVESPESVDASQWPGLLKDRDPDPQPTTILNSALATHSKPTPQPRK